MLKKFSLIAILLLAIQSVLAYDFDVIITKSREQIQCLIVEQNEDAVTYTLISDDTSQRYTIAMSDVDKIYYRNVDYQLEKKLKQQRERAREDSIAAIKLAEERARLKLQKAINDSIAAVRAERERIARAKEDSIAKREAEIRRAEANKMLKEFMGKGTITGSITLPEEKQEQQKSENVESTLLLIVTGLKEDLADVKQIIEKELSGQFSLDSYKVRKYDTLISNDTEETLLGIARQEKASELCAVRFVPYQSEYYVQAKIWDVLTGQLIATSSSSLALTNIETILNSTKYIADQLSKPLKLKKAEEEAEKERQLEAERRVKDILRQQEQEEQKHREVSLFNLFEEEETYFLTIENTKKYSCKVIVANRQIGIVNPNRTQQFVVPIYLFGKIQIVQLSNKGRPEETIYYIPKQKSRATVTLDNNDM